MPHPVTALTPLHYEVTQDRAKVNIRGFLPQVTEPFYPQFSYLCNGDNEIASLLCLLEEEMNELL